MFGNYYVGQWKDIFRVAFRNKNLQFKSNLMFFLEEIITQVYFRILWLPDNTLTLICRRNVICDKPFVHSYGTLIFYVFAKEHNDYIKNALNPINIKQSSVFQFLSIICFLEIVIHGITIRIIDPEK
jgi:hypothetical protein